MDNNELDEFYVNLPPTDEEIFKLPLEERVKRAWQEKGQIERGLWHKAHKSPNETRVQKIILRVEKKWGVDNEPGLDMILEMDRAAKKKAEEKLMKQSPLLYWIIKLRLAVRSPRR